VSGRGANVDDDKRGPDGQQDPIQASLGRQEDLYDVATWDVRSPLDSVASQLAELLRLTRKWSLIGLAALLVLAQVAIVGLLISEEPTLGILAVLSVVPALLLAGYFWFEDPTRREPVTTMAVTFLLSVLLATIAAIVNSTFSPFFELFPLVGLPLFFFLVVGPIEETVKWASIRLYAYRDERFDAVIDGAVYGAIAGLGFAAIENFTYIVNIYFAAADVSGIQPLAAAERTAYVRALVGPGHVIYSAFAGYYLGLAKFNPDDRGSIVVKGLLIAVFVHASYNTLVSLLPLTGLRLIAFLVVYDGFWFVVLYRKISRYRSYYRRARDAATASQRAANDELW
jgi:RsiW-degrading membrane proteinase PrsW (M82 family)